MNKPVIIIAEAGVNHNGSLELAKKLIDVAVDAGVDYVKFQTFRTEKLVTLEAKKAKYQRDNYMNGDDSQFEMLKNLELDENSHKELLNYCKQKGIGFLSTGFDEDSIDFLIQIGVEILKIPSGEITNKPYLQHIAKKLKPVIMSTGMCSLGEIENALNILLDEGIEREKVSILHCNTGYPTPMEDVNLKAMLTIRDAFKVNVGYSDHTMGIEVSIAAVALGATVIEKHFTLNRNFPGPDQKASLEPEELKQLVRSIRNIEVTMQGEGIKNITNSEKQNIFAARRSIHLSEFIKAGTRLKANHLVMMRPGDGISPMDMEKVLGLTIKTDLFAKHKLSWKDFL